MALQNKINLWPWSTIIGWEHPGPYIQQLFCKILTTPWCSEQQYQRCWGAPANMGAGGSVRTGTDAWYENWSYPLFWLVENIFSSIVCCCCCYFVQRYIRAFYYSVQHGRNVPPFPNFPKDFKRRAFTFYYHMMCSLTVNLVRYPLAHQHLHGFQAGFSLQWILTWNLVYYKCWLERRISWKKKYRSQRTNYFESRS